MPPTTTPEDRQMIARLGRAYVDPVNEEWAAAYFDRHTHPNHSDPAERMRHDKHVAAVAQLQTDIQRDHDAAAWRAQLFLQSTASRQELQVKIQQAQSDPAWVDKRHKDHDDAIARVSHLYKQLSASK